MISNYTKSEIINFLTERSENPKELIEKINEKDAFDSLLCAFTGFEFLQNKLTSLEDIEIKEEGITPEIIKEEGWIWTKLLED